MLACIGMRHARLAMRAALPLACLLAVLHAPRAYAHASSADAIHSSNPSHFSGIAHCLVDDDDEDASSASKPAPWPAAAPVYRCGPPQTVHIDWRERTHAVCASVALALFSPRPPPLN